MRVFVVLGAAAAAFFAGVLIAGRSTVSTDDERLVGYGRRWFLTSSVLLLIGGVSAAITSAWLMTDPEWFHHPKGLTNTEAAVLGTVGASALLLLAGYALASWRAWRSSWHEHHRASA